MKYSPSQVYMQESILDPAIELGFDIVNSIIQKTGLATGVGLKHLKGSYTNIGGTKYYVLGLSEVLKTFTTLGKECSEISNPILKKYCTRSKYKKIIKGLEELKTTGCNNSTNKSECQLKIQKEISKYQFKIEMLTREIARDEIEEIQIKNASQRDAGLYYGNEYEPE